MPPPRRNVDTVFQHDALFPHLTLWENVAFGSRSRGLATAELRCRGCGVAGGGARRLVIANGPIYIDPSRPGQPGSVERFETASGIRVTYNEESNDNQGFFAGIQTEGGWMI